MNYTDLKIKVTLWHLPLSVGTATARLTADWMPSSTSPLRNQLQPVLQDSQFGFPALYPMLHFQTAPCMMLQHHNMAANHFKDFGNLRGATCAAAGAGDMDLGRFRDGPAA